MLAFINSSKSNVKPGKTGSAVNTSVNGTGPSTLPPEKNTNDALFSGSINQANNTPLPIHDSCILRRRLAMVSLFERTSITNAGTKWANVWRSAWLRPANCSSDIQAASGARTEPSGNVNPTEEPSAIPFFCALTKLRNSDDISCSCNPESKVKGAITIIFPSAVNSQRNSGFLWQNHTNSSLDIGRSAVNSQV